MTAWRHSGPLKSPSFVPGHTKVNFFITTSGNFRTQALVNTMLEVSSDRILFSTDYPYESAEEAATWFDSCPISEPDRVRIGRDNAAKLFGLKSAAAR